MITGPQTEAPWQQHKLWGQSVQGLEETVCGLGLRFTFQHVMYWKGTNGNRIHTSLDTIRMFVCWRSHLCGFHSSFVFANNTAIDPTMLSRITRLGTMVLFTILKRKQWLSELQITSQDSTLIIKAITWSYSALRAYKKEPSNPIGLAYNNIVYYFSDIVGHWSTNLRAN